MGELRNIAPPFVASGPSGVAVRTRLKHLTPGDEKVLRLVGGHLGALASKDLKTRCRDGVSHSGEAWAVRKRELTPLSSSRWAGSITKATHDQWALARRGQLAYIQNLEAGVRTLEDRLALPVGQKGAGKAPGGYRSPREWHAKSRRLRVLQDRLTTARADRAAGIVHVVRGGKQLARTRHHLHEAGLTESAWRGRWEAERWFCQADGESGKRYGNETIRISPDGEASIKLPAPLTHLANASHGRYVLACRVTFAHRGGEWADRVAANRAVAYRVHVDTARDRWYVTASWQHPPTPTIPIETALAHGVVGVDMNADHLAAWRLDTHGNPTGSPRRFFYWQKPLTTTRKTTRHDAAAVAIGRRAQGHPIRRRTTPPPQHRSDAVGHRTVQARPEVPGREEPRPRIPGPRTRSVPPGRGANAGNQNAQHRPGRSAEHGFWQQNSLPLGL